MGELRHVFVMTYGRSGSTLLMGILNSIPGWLLRVIGLVHPPTRQLAVMQYQLEQPFVMESGKSQALLDLAPTPVEEMAAQTIAWWRTRTS